MIKMDEYLPVHICDDVISRDIPHDQMIERVFRRRSIEQNIPIDELALNPTYQVYRR
jgi:hypothetical protein